MNLEEKVEALGLTLGSRGWRDVIAPSARDALDICVRKIAAGEQLTDPERIRMAGLQWVIGWTRNYGVLADQLTVINDLRRSMGEPNEGGSPY